MFTTARALQASRNRINLSHIHLDSSVEKVPEPLNLKLIKLPNAKCKLPLAQCLIRGAQGELKLGRIMKILAKNSMREIVRGFSVLGMRALSSRPLEVDRGLVLRYIDKVKCRSKALESARGSRLSTEDASFMRRYRTLQPHIERLDDIIDEMQELRELLEVSMQIDLVV